MINSKVNTTGLKPKSLRYNNSRAIINLFRNSTNLSVRNASECVGLSRTSIKKIIDTLVEEGCVTPVGKGNSTDEGGKKPELYVFNSDYRYCISIYFDYELCIGKIMDLKMHILSTYTLSSNYASNFTKALSAIVKTVEELLKATKISTDMLCGIAICCPGVVHNGMLTQPVPNLGWGENIPIRKSLAEMLTFKTNIFIDNMCRYGGYYELCKKKSRRNSTYVVISTGETAGGCVIQNGQLKHGVNGLIGEIGHIKINHTTTRKCSCGNTGCFEAMVSDTALVSEALSLDYSASSLLDIIKKKDLKMSDIFNAANNGDIFSQSLLDQVTHSFAILINNIRFIYDPKEIIIQGTYASAGKCFQDMLQTQVSSMPFYNLSNELIITFSCSEFMDMVHTGAGLFSVDRFFESNFI